MSLRTGPWAAYIISLSAEPARAGYIVSLRTGGCFNKPNGLSDQMTDYRPMLFVHSRMVRRPVRRSVMLTETAPWTLAWVYTELENRTPGLVYNELENRTMGWVYNELQNRTMGWVYNELENRTMGWVYNELENRTMGWVYNELENRTMGWVYNELENRTRIENDEWVNV